MHSQLLSSISSKHPNSHCSYIELSRLEAMVQMINNGVRSHMYILSVQFSFGEQYGFVARCNIRGIMCEALASMFLIPMS